MQNPDIAVSGQNAGESASTSVAPYAVRIQTKELVTHDVLRIVTDKPPQYQFVPGQATEVAINKEGWREEKRPFTFTSLPDDNYLEFTTKVYPAHNGVTNQLLNTRAQEELVIDEAFGTIRYKGEGVFIAGGAGVTPFIAIFRQLEKLQQIGNNKLIFANKTRADIIDEPYFRQILGSNFINILSDETTDAYSSGYITETFLRKHIGSVDQQFYLCGPEPMMESVESQLFSIGVKPTSLIKEQF